MPQRFAVQRVVGDEVAAAVVAEQQSAGGAEQPHRAARAAVRRHRERMAPSHLAGLVIDGLQRAPDVAHVAFGRGPSLRTRVCICEIEETVGLRRADVEQPRIGVEARRRPVGGATRARRHERSRHNRILRGIADRLSLCVDLLRPVRRVDHPRRQDVLAVGAIEQEEMSVATRLRDELARTSVDDAVDQHGRLRGVPLVCVVRRHLIGPHHLAGVGVQRHDRAGPQIVARPALTRQHRLRIAGPDVIEVQLGIVRAGQPRHAAAARHLVLAGPRFGAGLTRTRRRVPAPHHLSALGIARLEIARDVERVAADADDHVTSDHDRRVRGKILALHARDLVVPALFSSRGLERDEVVVGREEVQPVAVHADAAVADVVAAAGLPREVPHLASRTRVDGVDVIGHREVENAVDDERRRFDARGRRHAGRRRVGSFAAHDGAAARQIRAVHPCERQILHVARVDLFQRAVAASRVVAVVRRPRIDRRLSEQIGAERRRLTREDHRQRADQESADDETRGAEAPRHGRSLVHLRLAR